MKNEVFKKLLEYLSSAESFLGTEIPDLLTQILQYDFYSTIVWFIVCLFICIIFGWLLYMYINIELEERADNSRFPFWALAILCISTFLLICNLNKMTMIKTAPKYYLMHKCKDLMK